MWGWFARRKLERRAGAYLKAHPEDEPVVEFILRVEGLLTVNSARELAQLAMDRKLSEDEWARWGPRWERAWTAIVR